MADRTESSTTVQTGPARVLEVIADFPAYPEWIGAVKEAEVLSSGSGGRAKHVRFVLDQGPIKDEYVLEYTWKVRKDGAGTVSWQMVDGSRTLKGMEGSYELAGSGEETDVTYRLTVDMRMPMLGTLKRKAERRIIETALIELKKRVEG